MNKIENVQKLIKKGQKVLATHLPNSLGFLGYPTLDSKAFSVWQTQSLNFLETNLPSDSTYLHSFRDRVKRGYRGTVFAGIEILTLVKEDLEAEELTQ
ncbi:MAG: hypothetical protein GQ468_06190 [Candidatus Scalindua sp.]|jgi:hypothetical protein|nr:hypothetical protein [Candidatus Scalindua sp.]